MKRVGRHIWRRVRRLGDEDSGQATVEYAVVAVWGVMLLFAAFGALRLAILDFYYDVASLICLPIP